MILLNQLGTRELHLNGLTGPLLAVALREWHGKRMADRHTLSIDTWHTGDPLTGPPARTGSAARANNGDLILTGIQVHARTTSTSPPRVVIPRSFISDLTLCLNRCLQNSMNPVSGEDLEVECQVLTLMHDFQARYSRANRTLQGVVRDMTHIREHPELRQRHQIERETGVTERLEFTVTNDLPASRALRLNRDPLRDRAGNIVIGHEEHRTHLGPRHNLTSLPPKLALTLSVLLPAWQRGYRSSLSAEWDRHRAEFYTAEPGTLGVLLQDPIEKHHQYVLNDAQISNLHRQTIRSSRNYLNS